LKVPDFHQVMTELVEKQFHKLEGRGFDYRCVQWGVVWKIPSGYTLDFGVESASNKNDYPRYFLAGKGGLSLVLSRLLSSFDNNLEILPEKISWCRHGQCRPILVCFVSLVSGKLYSSESLATGVSGYAVRLTTSLEFLPYLRIDKRSFVCFTVLVLSQFFNFT
jgi:hypothetical protein